MNAHLGLGAMRAGKRNIIIFNVITCSLQPWQKGYFLWHCQNIALFFLTFQHQSQHNSFSFTNCESLFP